jgi:type IV secretory pathway VirB10-like protein
MSDAEREAPVPEGRRRIRWTPARRATGIGLLAACVVGAVFLRDQGEREVGEAWNAAKQTLIRVETPPHLLANERPPPSVDTAPAAAAATYPPMPTASGGFLPGTDAPKRKRMMSYTTEDRSRRTAEVGGQSQGRGGAAAGGADGRTPAATNVAFAGEQIPGRRAGPAIDQTLTLMPGVYSCTLTQAMSSEHPGPFFCSVKRDIKSPLGVPLMRAGTTIQGSTQMMGGSTTEDRIMTLSAMAWTPEGIPVPLGNDPMGSEDGSVGFKGQVKRHIWRRLEGAVILMVTQGAMNAASAALQGALSGNNNTYLNLNPGGVNAALAQALSAGQHIRNTVTINAGTEVSFFVTAPISFVDAIDIEPVEPLPRARTR